MGQVRLDDGVHDLLRVFKENEDFRSFDDTIEVLIAFAEDNLDVFQAFAQEGDDEDEDGE
jgi:predicted CopG family antitoxin